MIDTPKRNTAIVIICMAIVTVLIMVACFNLVVAITFPPSDRYDIDAILGKDKEQIIQMYGEPLYDRQVTGNGVASEIAYPEDPHRFIYFYNGWETYHFVICFNDDDIAIKVYETYVSTGG